MLAVVEHEQRSFIRQCGDQLLDGLQPGDVMGSHRGQDRRSDARGIEDARELDKPDAAREELEQLGTHRERETRLAHSARAREGDEPLVDDELADRDDIVLPPDERRELHREVVTMRVERPQRSLSDGKLGMNHLPHALGPTEVLQPMRTEVGDVHAIGQLIGDQSGGGIGHEDLVTVPDRSQRRAQRITV